MRLGAQDQRGCAATKKSTDRRPPMVEGFTSHSPKFAPTEFEREFHNQDVCLIHVELPVGMSETSIFRTDNHMLIGDLAQRTSNGQLSAVSVAQMSPAEVDLVIRLGNRPFDTVNIRLSGSPEGFSVTITVGGDEAAQTLRKHQSKLLESLRVEGFNVTELAVILAPILPASHPLPSRPNVDICSRRPFAKSAYGLGLDHEVISVGATVRSFFDFYM